MTLTTSKTIQVALNQLSSSLTNLFDERSDFCGELSNGWFFEKETVQSILDEAEDEGASPEDLHSLVKILKKMEDEEAEFFFISGQR